MAEVRIYINGRSYDVSCDTGQEGRVVDLASYVDKKLQHISRSGAAYNDAHLMVLTTLVLADELFDMHDAEQAQQAGPAPAAPIRHHAAGNEDDLDIMRIIEQLTLRIDRIATRVQSA